MGRPQNEVPAEIVDTACQLNATQTQVLEALRSQGYRTSLSTLVRYIEREHGCTFEQYREQRTANTKLKLVQKAVKMAMEGNATMLIFCLKNMCDWRDKPKDDPEDKFKNMTIRELILYVKEHVPELKDVTPS
jgi:hypothetical protein